MRLPYLRLLTSLVLLLLGLMLSQRSVAGVHNFPQPSSSAGAEKIADMDELASRVLEKLKKAHIKVIAVTPFSLEKIGGYHGLDENALAALQHWQFAPARLPDGTLVSSRIDIEIKFHFW